MAPFRNLGMPGSFGYLSPEEKSRREKGYQDRMARQQTFMDENPLVPQVQNLDLQLLGGPNDPLSENYIDPRIEMREIKRQQQAEYDASERPVRRLTSPRPVLDPRGSANLAQPGPVLSNNLDNQRLDGYNHGYRNTLARYVPGSHTFDRSGGNNTGATGSGLTLKPLRQSNHGNMPTIGNPYSPFDDSGIQAQIGGLQKQFGNIIGNMPSFDPTDMQAQIQANQASIGNMPTFDDSGIQAQIGGLQEQFGNMPTYDDSQLRKDMDSRFGNMPSFDPSGLQDQIKSLQASIGNMPQFDPSEMQAQIQANQASIGNMPSFDPTDMQSQIQANQASIGNMPTFDPSQYSASFDPTDMQAQIQANQASIGNMPSFDPTDMQAQIQANQASIGNMPSFDPTDMQAQIQANQASIGNMPSFDPSQYSASFDPTDMQPPFGPPQSVVPKASWQDPNIFPPPAAAPPAAAPPAAAPPAAAPPAAAPPAAAPPAAAPPAAAPPGQLPPPTVAAGETPYVSGVNQTTITSDPTTQQLLFGLDGQGGFIPGAMQAAENTFFNPDGTPRVVDQEVAGLMPDQERAMELARGQVGIQDRYLGGAEDLFQEGVRRSDEGLARQIALGQDALGTTQRGVSEEQALRDRGLEGLLSSIGEGRQLAGGATSDLYGRLGETENIQRGAVDQFGRQLGGIESMRRGAVEDFGGRLGESEDLIRGTTGAYDQDLTKEFYDPYEDRVVNQTIEDALKGSDKADMAQFARDVSSGGESAFGSRARLTAGERRESLGRGLAQELAGIRSRGFTEAQRAGTSEFARQKAAQGAAGSNLAGLSGQRLGAQQQLASGLGSLSGQQLAAQQGLASGLGQAGQQRYGAGTNLGSTLVGLGQTGQQAMSGAGRAALGSAGQLAGAQGQMGGLYGQGGQQQQESRAGLGRFMQGLGSQAQQAGMTGINALAGFGGQQQQLMQQMLDAQRQNAMMRQQAPLAQYQSLLPFIQAVPQGQQQTQTAYSPRPSALQAALGTGLSTFGGIGSYMNQAGPSAPTQQQGGLSPAAIKQLEQLLAQRQPVTGI